MQILNKINWGWRIAILYLSFVFFILFMVFRAQQESIELVTTDYYAKELKYQEQLDKMNRANALAEPLQWNVDASGITLLFPIEQAQKGVKANVLLYCPSNSKNDFAVDITVDEQGKYFIPASKLNSAVYQLQIEWQAADVSYYNEGTIKIQ
jgi:hypothetical protein